MSIVQRKISSGLQVKTLIEFYGGDDILNDFVWYYESKGQLENLVGRLKIVLKNLENDLQKQTEETENV